MTSKTKQAISSLDWAISQTIDQPKTDDEFTLAEYSKATGATLASAKSKLSKTAGISSRLVTLNGTRTNLYRRA